MAEESTHPVATHPEEGSSVDGKLHLVESHPGDNDLHNDGEPQGHVTDTATDTVKISPANQIQDKAPEGGMEETKQPEDEKDTGIVSDDSSPHSDTPTNDEGDSKVGNADKSALDGTDEQDISLRDVASSPPVEQHGGERQNSEVTVENSTSAKVCIQTANIELEVKENGQGRMDKPEEASSDERSTTQDINEGPSTQQGTSLDQATDLSKMSPSAQNPQEESRHACDTSLSDENTQRDSQREDHKPAITADEDQDKDAQTCKAREDEEGEDNGEEESRGSTSLAVLDRSTSNDQRVSQGSPKDDHDSFYEDVEAAKEDEDGNSTTPLKSGDVSIPHDDNDDIDEDQGYADNDADDEAPAPRKADRNDKNPNDNHLNVTNDDAHDDRIEAVNGNDVVSNDRRDASNDNKVEETIHPKTNDNKVEETIHHKTNDDDGKETVLLKTNDDNAQETVHLKTSDDDAKETAHLNTNDDDEKADAAANDANNDDDDDDRRERNAGVEALDVEERQRLMTEVDVEGQQETKVPQSKGRMLKNLLVMCFGFMLLFTAYSSMQNLQTSLNQEEGVGPGSMAIVYGLMVGMCMFSPSLLISRLGCKWTIPLSMAGYVLFMAANLHATWWLMAPAAALVGLGAPPLWSAKCAYVTQIGVWTARLTGQSRDAIINRFFGIFFMSFQTAFIWGNLISSTVFKPGDVNLTSAMEDLDLVKCGAAYCPWHNQSQGALPRPEKSQVYTLCGIFIGLAGAAVVFEAIFLDPVTLEADVNPQEVTSLGHSSNDLTSYQALDTIDYPGHHDDPHEVIPNKKAGNPDGSDVMVKVKGDDEKGHMDRKSEKRSAGIGQLVKAAFRHLWNSRDQKLLIPLTMYSGFEQAFLWGDYTESYIACALGIWNIGYVLVCYGVADSVCSFLFGRLVKHVGHIPFFILAAVVQSAAMMVLLLWQPDPSKVWVFYVLAALWGTGDAVIQTQINAFYGYLFSSDSTPAFANYRLFESLGIIITFIYNDYVCTNHKLYINLAVLAVGMLGYAIVEVRQRSKDTGKKE